MKIGIIMPLIYMSAKLYPHRIFAPAILCLDLCDTLVDLGHEVFLFSTDQLPRPTKAKVIPIDESFFEKEIGYCKLKNRPEEIKKLVNFELKKRLFEQDAIFTAFKYTLENKLDILHCYHDSITYLAHQLQEFSSCKVLFNLHDPLPPEGTMEYELLKKFKHHSYISISNSQRKSNLNLNFVKTIYHGINLNDYLFKEKSEQYFLFMGRLVPEKGLHTALQTAIKLDYPLKTGTTIDKDEVNSEYYQTKVKPYLKYPQIQEANFVDKGKRINYYQNAKALLFPIEWEEPFGMVMIEAMACGTPVVGFARGSVPEIVKDGVTGFVVDPSRGQDGFMKAAQRILDLSEEQYLAMRQNCRKHVEKNFTNEITARNYEKVYSKIAKIPT